MIGVFHHGSETKEHWLPFSLIRTPSCASSKVCCAGASLSRALPHAVVASLPHAWLHGAITSRVVLAPTRHPIPSLHPHESHRVIPAARRPWVTIPLRPRCRFPLRPRSRLSLWPWWPRSLRRRLLLCLLRPTNHLLLRPCLHPSPPPCLSKGGRRTENTTAGFWHTKHREVFGIRSGEDKKTKRICEMCRVLPLKYDDDNFWFSTIRRLFLIETEGINQY